MEKRATVPEHAMRLAVLLLLLAQAASPPQFKSCVNLVELDIVVTHSTGVPVRGLSLEDFNIRGDGQPVERQRLPEVTVPKFTGALALGGLSLGTPTRT